MSVERDCDRWSTTSDELRNQWCSGWIIRASTPWQRKTYTLGFVMSNTSQADKYFTERRTSWQF